MADKISQDTIEAMAAYTGPVRVIREGAAKTIGKKGRRGGRFVPRFNGVPKTSSELKACTLLNGITEQSKQVSLAGQCGPPCGSSKNGPVLDQTPEISVQSWTLE